MATFTFRVYVTGESRRATQAVNHLRTLCEGRVDGDYDIEVIDVLEQPDAADQARIMATPTIVRISPHPQRRVVGDLTDMLAAAAALELPETPAR